jgi:hypothetical protein
MRRINEFQFSYPSLFFYLIVGSVLLSARMFVKCVRNIVKPITLTQHYIYALSLIKILKIIN